MTPYNHSVKLHLRPSRETEASASRLVGVDTSLNERPGATLFRRIPVGNQLCAMRLVNSSKVSNRRLDRCYLFTILVYTFVDGSAEVNKGISDI